MRHVADRLDALTGLRFVAAAAVFASHLKEWVQITDFDPGTMGSAAVGFFFVLSGFILSHVYRSGPPTTTTSRFYRARFARIWPTHWACIAAMIAMSVATGSQGRTPELTKLLDHTLLLQAWTTDAAWAQDYNGPAWSLSVEVFFYAVFPLLIQRSGRQLAILYALCLLVSGSLWFAADRWATPGCGWEHGIRCVATIGPIARLQEFVLGVFVHELWGRRATIREQPAGAATIAEIAVVLAVVASFRAFSSSGWGAAWVQLPSWPTTATALSYGPGLSWAFAAAIYVFASGRGILSSALGSAPMRFLGETSYAFYLVHSAVLMGVASTMRSYEFVWETTLVAGLGTSIGVAALLHALVEQPARVSILSESGLVERIRIYGSTAARALRTRGLLTAVCVSIASWAVTAAAPPTLQDVALSIGRQSPLNLKDVPFGSAATMLGALTQANSSEFQVWVAIREASGVPHTIELEARSRDDQLVHTFQYTTRRFLGSDGSHWTVHNVTTPIAQLLGASLLMMRMTTTGGSTALPRSGPRTSDGQGLELLRLPW